MLIVITTIRGLNYIYNRIRKWSPKVKYIRNIIAGYILSLRLNCAFMSTQ